MNKKDAERHNEKGASVVYWFLFDNPSSDVAAICEATGYSGSFVRKIVLHLIQNYSVVFEKKRTRTRLVSVYTATNIEPNEYREPVRVRKKKPTLVLPSGETVFYDELLHTFFGRAA